MKASSPLVCASLLAVGALVSSSAVAHDGDGGGKIVSVAFGAGINTAQPGNVQNHHVIPNVIKVKVGDVVNFVVAGLHVIRVYDRGVRLRDLRDLAAGTITDDRATPTRADPQRSALATYPVTPSTPSSPGSAHEPSPTQESCESPRDSRQLHRTASATRRPCWKSPSSCL
jgi:hypothetical protein